MKLVYTKYKKSNMEFHFVDTATSSFSYEMEFPHKNGRNVISASLVEITYKILKWEEE